MTTQNSPKNEQPEEGNDYVSMSDDVATLLAPYEPVTNEKEADTRFSTAELIAALEEHYGVPQGDVSYHTPNAGLLIVKKMKELKFLCKNTGGLKMEWLMRKRVSA